MTMRKLFSVISFFILFALSSPSPSRAAQCSDVATIAAGEFHTVALKQDGTVAAVGYNNSGQLNVSSWTNIKAIAVSDYHTVGLKQDGTVVAVGDNSYGQLNVSSWTNIKAIAASNGHTVGLKEDGTVVAVGNYNDGQLNVSTWTNIKAIAAGPDHTVGLRENGTVVAVGVNWSGELNVSSWTNIKAVATGSIHTVGLKEDGTVVAAGWNGSGLLNVSSWRNIKAIVASYGNTLGLKEDGTVVAVGWNGNDQLNASSWTNIKAIAAGSGHIVGLKQDGTLVAVGDNSFSQLNISSWTKVMAIAAGEEHTIGLKEDGTVVAVGVNWSGELNVSSWTKVMAIAAGYYHTVGLKEDGTVVAVGNYNYGQLNVSSWTNIKAIAAGYGHTVGLRQDGTVVAVGWNGSDLLNVSSWTNIKAIAAGGFYTVGLKEDGTVVVTEDYYADGVSSWTNIKAIAAGNGHTVGLKEDGTVVAVGDNQYGQLNVSSWTNIKAVAVHGNHTVGLKEDGTVVAVGDNTNGQLNVSSWTNIKAIATGWLHTVGLKDDGTFVGTGDNSAGQLNFSFLFENIMPVCDAAALPQVSISPASKDFGSVAVNATSAVQAFTIANTGAANLLVSGITTAGGDNGMFSIEPGTCGALPAIIAPNANCSVSVAFSPTSTGAKSTTLLITTNDPITPDKEITLTGTGILGTYAISTSVAGNGTIICDSPVTQGNNSTCTITPDVGYRLAAFTDNGADKFPSISGNSYTISNVTADHAIVGFFALKDTPVITWANPADITYGTALSGTQMNATANVAGTFAYTPAAGTVLNAGTQVLSVTFTPTDAANYTTATMTVTVNVAKASPVVTWANPADITYGTALSATQLNAAADVAGTFAYAPAAGTVLNAGTQVLSVTFTPTDTANYTTATKTVTINVAKATPVITWANPADIAYGTALSATQLNATADVAGTFAYTPAAGTVLNAGTQVLSVTFTPTDAANYTNQAATVNLTVTKLDQTITFPAIGTKKVGDPDFDPGASVSTGLPITYTSSNTSVAIISGGLIQIVSGGTTTITASQAGNINFNPATSQTQALTVTGQPSKSAAITISTPADGTITSNVSLNIVGSVDGLKNNDTITINVINNGITTFYTVTPAFPSGNFSSTVSLGDGANVIETIATNSLGTTTDRRTVVLTSP